MTRTVVGQAGRHGLGVTKSAGVAYSLGKDSVITQYLVETARTALDMDARRESATYTRVKVSHTSQGHMLISSLAYQ